MDSISDFSEDDLKVEVDHEGINLQGHFNYISMNDFNVVLDGPLFSDIDTGLHSPYFSRPCNIVDGKITERCLGSAKSCLIKLHEVCCSFSENSSLIKDFYKFVLEEEAAAKKGGIGISLEEFKINRIELRKQLRSGKLSSLDYGKIIHGLCKQVNKQEIALFMVRDKFKNVVYEICGRIVGIDLMPKMIEKFIL